MLQGWPNMSAEEFQSSGLLQEVNRQFFHPLGLAMTIYVNEDGTKSYGSVLDCRADPMGIWYSPGSIDAAKAQRWAGDMNRMAISRLDGLGYIVQPVPEKIFEEEKTCEAFQWIGQSFKHCDRCGEPYWDHTHLETVQRDSGPFGPMATMALSDEDREAVKRKWDRPAATTRNPRR